MESIDLGVKYALQQHLIYLVDTYSIPFCRKTKMEDDRIEYRYTLLCKLQLPTNDGGKATIIIMNDARVSNEAIQHASPTLDPRGVVLSGLRKGMVDSLSKKLCNGVSFKDIETNQEKEVDIELIKTCTNIVGFPIYGEELKKII